MNTGMSVDIQRAAYMRIHAQITKMVAAKGLSADDYQIEPHTLIVVGKPTTKGSIEWNLETGDTSAPTSMQILLKKSDAFGAWGVGIQLTKVDRTAGEYGSYPLFTYPEPTFFDGATATGNFEWKALMNIYRGKLSMKTGTTERISDFATQHFLVTPERVATGVVSLPQYGPHLEDEGIFLLQPQPIYNGALTNTFRLNFGEGDYAAIAGKLDPNGAAIATENCVLLNIHGWKVNNVVDSFTQQMEDKNCGYV